MTYKKKVKGSCGECGCTDVYADHEYLPDFIIGNVVLETKGIWNDKYKMVELQKAYPDYTFVMLFQNAAKKVTKKVTYIDWAKNKGLQALDIKKDWVTELKEIIKKHK